MNYISSMDRPAYESFLNTRFSDFNEDRVRLNHPTGAHSGVSPSQTNAFGVSTNMEFSYMSDAQYESFVNARF